MALNNKVVPADSFLGAVKSMSANSTPQIFPETLVPPVDLTRLRALAAPRRTVKIAFAVTLCSAGVFGMFSESAYISTSNAVVSAFVVDVRTPIDGTISGLPLGAGSLVEANEVLGSVDNPRSDRQHLDNLLTLENSARSTVEAFTAERVLLHAQESALLARAHLHSTAVASRLKQQSVEAERTLSGLQLALVEATTELRRAEQLLDNGILARSEFDRIRSVQAIAVEVVAAQQSHFTIIRDAAIDATHGLFSEPGAVSDVSYSRQRADEIAIKLAENSSALDIAVGQSNEAHRNVEAETVRGGLMRQSALRSPIQGSLWKVNATNGESTTSGASVITLVDCNSQFLLAQVPQSRVPTIALHREARIRFSGESEERTGTVLSVSGDALKVPDAKLAALPFQESSQQMATVLIALNMNSASPGPNVLKRTPQSQNSPCLVGRTARVLIPTFSTNLAARWVRELF
jgi:multidrug resistance efflux pump